MVRNRMVLCLFFLLIIQIVSGEDRYAFRHLSSEEGLSQMSGTSLLQDSWGFVWVGTREGLNRYDGNDFRVFRHIPGDSTSLLDNNIKSLHQSSDGRLWIHTSEGLSVYHPVYERFDNHIINGLQCIDVSNDTVYVGTRYGFFFADIRESDFRLQPGLDGLQDNVVSVFRHSGSGIWLATRDHGAWLYSPEGDRIKVYEGEVNAFYADSRGSVWAGTASEGVLKLSSSGELVNHFRAEDSALGLVNGVVRDIVEDAEGKVWIGTFKGISIIDDEIGEVINIEQSFDRGGLSHGSIHALMRDDEGNVWVGTYFGGINIWHTDERLFKLYPTGVNDGSGLSFHVAGQMLEDEKGNLWVATEGGGLNYFDRESNTFSYYLQDTIKGLSNNNVKALYKDRHHLYIGTHLGGLSVLDVQNETFVRYLVDSRDSCSIPSNIISAIIPGSNNELLLGTNDGVVVFNKETKCFSPFFDDLERKELVGDKILSLYKDRSNRIWIGSEVNGLSVYAADTDELKNYRTVSNNPQSLGSNHVYQVYQDHYLRLWVATSGGGLNLLHRDEQGFVRYTTHSHNLPSNHVLALSGSRYGYLWVTTSHGLFRFDVEQETFLFFDQSNGFPLFELNERGLCITHDGEIFVSGLNGMLSFSEKELEKPRSMPDVFITQLYINNRRIKPDDDSGILKKAIEFTESFKLKSHHTVISIEYASLAYSENKKIPLLYRLKGFEDDWVNGGFRHHVSYTNLKPGKYVFQLGVADRFGQEVTVRELAIRVVPPFYLSVWAFVIYASLIVLIIFIANRVYVSKIAFENQIRNAEIEKEQVDRLNQDKLRFFTNVSHEFRTPLALIYGVLENIIQDNLPSRSLNNKLLQVFGNVRRLRYLIDELLEFRKFDARQKQLRPDRYEVNEVISGVVNSFGLMAEERSIAIEFKPFNNGMHAVLDRFQLEKVLYNLIYNALKFAVTTIVVRLEDRNDKYCVMVQDDGTGIEEDKQKLVFGNFYQAQSAFSQVPDSGFGIGLSLSYEIIKAHGGELKVKSQPGDTVFEFELEKHALSVVENPGVVSYMSVAAPFVPEVESEEEDSFFSLDVTAQSEELIVVVEDNLEMCQLIKEILLPHYRVAKAFNGKDGYQLIRKLNPDLIVSDLMMPKMSGIELCRAVREDTRVSHIPFVLLTSKTDMQERIVGIQTGADDFIFKPFDKDYLVAKCTQLINSRNHLKKLFSSQVDFLPETIAHNDVDKELVRKAFEIVRNNLANSNLDIAFFASSMGFSRTVLFNKIKGLTGQTPNDFILNIRLRFAAEMLRSKTGTTVSEVAYSTGFNDPKYFSKVFRKHFGILPSECVAAFKK